MLSLLFFCWFPILKMINHRSLSNNKFYFIALLSNKVLCTGWFYLSWLRQIGLTSRGDFYMYVLVENGLDELGYVASQS